MSHMSIAYCNQIVEYLRELHFSSGTLSNAKGTLSIEIPERRRLRHREYQNDARSSANHSVFDLPSLSGLRGLKKEKQGRRLAAGLPLDAILSELAISLFIRAIVPKCLALAAWLKTVRVYMRGFAVESEMILLFLLSRQEARIDL